MMLVCCVQVFMLLTTMLETGVLGQVDELLTDGSSNNPRYLTDGNDSTCNPDANARLIQVTFNTSISTLFIRIRTNNNITLFYRNFTREATFSICPMTQLYRVDDKTADIRCHNDAPTMIIRMESRLVPYICTMHVSGGRLISLRRPANQSSTYSGDNWDKVKADNAVDGNNSTDFASGSCTRTQRELAHPYFTLKFDVPSNIYKVIIFNTNDARYQLSRFLFSILNASKRIDWSHWEKSPQPLSVYVIRPDVAKVVTAMKISTTIASASEFVLSLCEVQVFGYAHCPSSKYGDSCQHQCPCSSGVECHQMTGSCEYMPASYCPVGTYGDMCEFPCPENCHYDLCDAHSGGCLHCIPGYKGEFCDQVCTPGTFGINCSLKCPEKCAEPCNHITAVCSCVEGFTGDLCTECVSGLYGRNCSQKCPHLCNMRRCHMLTGECETCIDKYAGPFCEECDSGWFGDNCTKICPRICPGNRCNNITGHCMSCVGGRTGPKCEDCPAGYYGALCEIPCSVYCRNKSCHEVGGACYACIDGYRGEYCHSEIEQSYPSVWLWLLLIPAFVLFLLCFTVGGGDIGHEDE